jgi:hypothetical protein
MKIIKKYFLIIKMLHKTCNRIFPNFVKSLGIFSQFDRGIYDSIQYRKYGKHPNAFLGRLLCGESCFILKYLLEKNGYDVKVYRNHEDYGELFTDHVFIKVGENIVDPTYRQFVVNKCDREKLFTKTPPILVSRNIKKSIGELVGEEEYLKIKRNWKTMEDVSSKFNLEEFVKDEKLLNDKPCYYRELVNSVK